MALISSRITPEFRFNVTAQRYVTSDGRFVARETVKAASEAVVSKADQSIETVSQRFLNGEITHAEWDAEMRLNIRRSVVGNSILASGGFENMDPAKYGRAGALTKTQYEFLNGMGERIQSGYYGDDLSKNGFMAHARQYANAGRHAFEYSQAMNHLDGLGHNQVANVYGGNEHHCDGEGSCQAMNDLGWVSPDDPRWLWPGQRLCKGGDLCGVKTRKGTA